jgi:DNA-binding MarR family transcriptional regulator/GNAT superfamily N-acetyltransferase
MGQVGTDVETVRRFNRYYTERVGALSDRYLGQNRPLAEARLLFEIGRSGRPLRELRSTLGLDSGYLARLLRSLEQQRLVTVGRDPNDRRARVATLTRLGSRELRTLDERSDTFAERLLATVPGDDRSQLLGAMDAIYRLLRRSGITIRAADPDAADVRRCLLAYAAELGDRFPEGYDVECLVSVQEIRANGACLVAYEECRPVGCGVLKCIDGRMDEVKHLWVAPDVRGIGVSRMLLNALEGAARLRSKVVLRLDTHVVLTEAISLYRSAGYVEIPPYGSNPHAGVWFEKQLQPCATHPDRPTRPT